MCLADIINSSRLDQHEDDACCDVQTPDRAGDARLHIETLHGTQAVAGQVA